MMIFSGALLTRFYRRIAMTPYTAIRSSSESQIEEEQRGKADRKNVNHGGFVSN